MSIVDTINQARQAGYSDDEILSEVAKQNPAKTQTFSQASQAGYRPADILDEVIAQNTPKKQSFLTGLVNDPFKTLIAKPAERFAQAVAAPIAYGASALTGNDQYKTNYENYISQDQQVPGIIPGSMINIEATKSGIEGAKQIGGEALKSASYIAPAGRTIKGAVALGGASGAAYGAGDVLEQGGTVGEALTSGAISGVASAGTAGVLRGAGPLAKGIKDRVVNPSTKFTVSQATGMSPNTISQILKNPEKLTGEAAAQFDEMALPTRIDAALKKELSRVSDTGKEYSMLRSARTPVEIPREGLESILKKYGIDFDADGKMMRTIDTVAMKPGDQADIERFWNEYGKYQQLNSNAVLNARGALDLLADYGKDPSKSDVSDRIAHDIRKLYDGVAKAQVKGLEAVDKKYAPMKKEINKLRKDYLNADGSLKDNALSKIHALTTANKSIVLKRLEKLMPGIGEEINMAAALRDIAGSQGIKVGTYARGSIFGAGAGTAIGAAVAGPMGAVVGSTLGTTFGLLVANPATAVPIIRAFAKSKKIAEPVIEGIIDRIRKGKPLSDGVKKLIYAAIADHVGDSTVQKEDNQTTDSYLKSLGL